MVRGWILPLVFVACGAAVAASLAVGGAFVAAVAVLAAFLLLGAVNSPLLFPRSVSAAQARRLSAAHGRPVVYWRPGCAFCQRLRMRLGRRARQLHWVNIWRDPDGAATVRAANDGNETVPTVFVDGTPHTNPDPAWVREQITARGRG
ncbi:glutaredoxin domain-containing protein [Streptomyces sp. NPDC001941]|uniref:glutaredoxin domain-containing protein n=1 Tax=Streptomyces sp. NPDC001941 TaxID=3154659 RepID=UPI00331A6C2D